MQKKQKFTFLKFARWHGPHHDTNKAYPVTVMKWFMTAGRLHIKQKIIFLNLIGIIFLIPLVFNSCREDATSPAILKISLTAEDAGVTDALINLRAEYIAKENVSFQIRRDGLPIFTLTPAPLDQRPVIDTVVIDDTLSPNRSYTYKAYRMIAAAAIDSSAPLTITTMDTTSHNFTWQIDTLGDGSSSVLYDVAIINDTLAYAVGEIYKKDSTGQFETEPYGAAIWNGKTWRLQKLFAWTPTGYASILMPHGIIAFSATDIWIASGGVHHWDGKSTYVTSYWINYFPGNPNPILSSGQSAVKLWGTSSSNLYVVGNQGAIAFFNGSSWRKIESGTTLDIQDIWGSIDKKNNETEVIAVASNQWKSADRKILKISGMNCVMLSDNPLKYPLYSIYFESERKYYVAGDGIFEKKLLSDSIWRNKPFDFAQYFIFRIRGSNLNNVIAVGGYGEAVHFNGSSWKSYHDIVGIGYGNYYSVDIKNKMIIIVGQEYPKAIIAVGKRK